MGERVGSIGHLNSKWERKEMMHKVDNLLASISCKIPALLHTCTPVSFTTSSPSTASPSSSHTDAPPS